MTDPVPQFKRRSVTVSAETVVQRSLLVTNRSLPLAIRPALSGVGLLAWATRHRDALHADLDRHGAVLLRGFSGASVESLEQLITALCGELIEYTHRSTPRTRVSGRIFTSTEYPADQTIPLHNEMSYTRSWPAYLCLCCLERPEHGGETPIGDSRRVYDRISPRVRDRFMRDGVMYVRNYGHRVDLPWQEVFQTDDRAQVEEYCRSAEISVEWKPDGGLRTTQVCQAAVAHPRTGEMVWFNQAHLFHVSVLEPAVRESLFSMFAEEDLPRNAYYGDGSAIEASTFEEIRAAYDAEEVAFPWEEGDVLILDNVLSTHGRRPFSGRRRIVVGMSARGGLG